MTLSAINLVFAIVCFFALSLSTLHVCARSAGDAEYQDGEPHVGPIQNQASGAVAPIEHGGYTTTWVEGRLYP